ncbi:MAG: DUF2071 domain-containing protein [Planctomycetota bacterium]
MAMRWSDLLFAHWPIDAQVLRATLPGALRPHLDTFEGQAWLGVVPFMMSRVRGVLGPAELPAVPGLSRFPELNLRTYVNVNGVPGVWFFSLDAQHKLAVRTARLTFGLPYFDADMRCTTHDNGRTDYRSTRTHRGVPGAEFDATYESAGDAFETTPGMLEHFLTARYCLFAQRRGRLLRGDILHDPWRLRPAAWDVRRCDMTRLLGVPLPNVSPHLLYAEPLDVWAWWPRSAG